MDWRIAGDYLMACTCTREIHWPMDGSMSDANGACSSCSVFRIETGDYWGENLAGLMFAVFNFFPPKISTGDWQMGIVLEESVTDQQAAAVEAVMRGREGGSMAAVAGLIGDYIGTDQGSIGWLEGDRPYVAVEGRGRFTFFPTRREGQPIPAPNAMWAFAEHYEIGRAQGHLSAFGHAFQADYGEYGKFSFNANNTGMEREFRPSRLGGLFGGTRPPGNPFG